VHRRRRIEIKAAANGKFKVPNVTTKTEETVFIEAIGDPDSELSAVAQEVNIQRYVTAVFNLHGARGTFNIYVDAGELGDLYYIDTKSFTL
jgi:hypothetical protein